MNTLKVIDRFSGDYALLSNFAYVSGGVPFGGIMFPTVEHAFQAAKTADVGARRRIWLCRPPGQARRMGRQLTLRANWEHMKYDVMYTLLSYKFHRIPFKDFLLDTHPTPLVEGNTWGDMYWGVYNGVGQNVLGRLLMQIRNELIAERNE